VFASLIDVQASQIIQSSLANVQANVGLAFKDQLEFRGYSGLISLGVSTLLPIAIVKTWKLAGRLIRNPVEMALKLAAKLPASTKCLGVCNEFAAALRQALVEAQVPGKLIRIDAGPSSHIHSDTLGPLSGTESFHEAIQVGDKVFDNMRPEGMPIQMFFDDLGGREFLVRETGARIRWTDF
jgi:hypothetical protein